MSKCCNHHHHVLAPEKRPAEGAERQLIEDLIASMNHPSAVIAEVAVGSHFIGIRAEGEGQEHAGLASTLGAAPSGEELKMVDDLIGKPLGEAVELLKSDSPFSISLGAAALNTGLAAPDNPPDIEASRIMAEKGRDGENVLVGDFPFTQWLSKQVKTLHLFELRKVAGAAPMDQWDAILGRCKVLGLTGTTLLTRAMATYLKKAPQAYTVVIGPTTPISPVLFSYGVDVLAGSRIVNPGPVFEGIRQGQSFREFKKLGIQFLACAKDISS